MVSVFLLAACTDKAPDPVEPTDTTDTVPEGVGQTPSCAQYLVCLEAVGSNSLDLEQQVYGPDGECWVSAAEALACDQACEAGLLAEAALHPAEVSCWSTLVPPTSAVFEEVGADWEVSGATGDTVLCNALDEATFSAVGTESEEFDLTVSVLLSGALRTTYSATCALAPDQSFTCTPPATGALGTWSGAFSSDWATLDVDVAYRARACTLTATPGSPPPDPQVLPVTGGIDPTSVAFEMVANMGPTGRIEPWTYFDGSDVPPEMTLFFADAEYFVSGDDADICSAGALFGSDPAYGGIVPFVKPAQIPITTTDKLYWSYEAALDLDTAFTATTCDTKVDALLWGLDGELLLEPFVGARIGIGFGPTTDYLEQFWVGVTDQDFLDARLAMYVAINDKDGNWVGDDWGSAIVYKTDPVTGEPLVDVDYYLTDPLDVTGLAPGAALPSGLLLTYAFWFQDFALMDFSNLTDGAP